MIDIRLKILAVLPFFIVLATVFIVSRVDLERFVLKAGERRLLHFSPEKNEMEINRPGQITVNPYLKHVNFFYNEPAGKNTYLAVKRVDQQTAGYPKKDSNTYSIVNGAEQIENKSDMKKEAFLKQDSNDTEKNPTLTFIVLNGTHSIAIVNDRVLHEGETVGSMTVTKIEKDKVLVRDKTLRWIYMEGEK